MPIILQSERLQDRLSTRIRFLLSGVAMLSAVSFFIVPSASGVTTQKARSCTTANGIKVTDAEVCKGLAFYKGTTLDFIEPASVGGPFDLQAEAEIPGLESYLGTTINETRITTGNSVPGQDALASSVPNGLTIGLLNPLN